MTSTLTNTDKLPRKRTLDVLPGNGFSRAFGTPLIAIIVTLLLLLTMGCVDWLVRNSMRQAARASLESTLASDVAALQLWWSSRRGDVGRIAKHGDVQRHSLTLLNEFASTAKLDVEQLAAAPSARQLAAQIPADLIRDNYVGWLLMDADGRVISTSHSSLLAKSFDLPKDTRDQFDGGQTMVLPPMRAAGSLTDSGPLSKAGCAVMFAVAPISEGLRTLGGFALIIDPLEQFSDILSASRTGQSGESYAFDRRGIMLSQSRFESELRDAGLLDNDLNFASPLNVRLVDSESAMTNTNGSGEQATLTLLADRATRGGTGANVTGYNNYLGVSVIGAWRWLPDQNLCVGTEIHYAEAFAPLAVLRNSLAGAIAIVSLAGLAALMLLRRRNTSDASMKDLNRRLGQYDVGKMIGRGGMGSVYHGRHQLLKRDVAVKVLEYSDATKRSLSRFEREVQMTAKLCHPNTIEIYDYGQTGDGTFFYVMEYVDGISLQELVDHYGRQPPERVIYLLLQICGSISEAHKQLMVHRDIKPANILLAVRAGLFDLVKVLDFGLVKEINRDTVELTITESMTGTPLYMSPEAIRDASKADQRSDLYSIGAVGYTLLTGLPTFDGPTAADICAKHLNEEPVRPSVRIRQAISDDLQNILMTCLRKDADERPASADDLAEALMQCKDFGKWTVVDAHQWWEQVFDGPRDDLDDFNDNPRPQRAAESPSSLRRSATGDGADRPGHDTKVNDSGNKAPSPTDQPSEKAAR